MAKVIKIKISPDNWAGSRPIGEETKETWLKPAPAPTFELKLIRSDFLWTSYSWSCLPGYLSAVSGSAYFTDWGNSVLSLTSSDGKPCCYGLLDKMPSDFAVGSRGGATIDYGGYWLKKRLEGAKNIPEILKEIFRKSDLTMHSNWEIVEAY